jgi:PIN domain nuclease of toxin-antitoxin system
VSSAVIDTSVILAILNEELAPKAIDLLLDLLADGALSTVNLAEVHGKLVLQGIDPEKAWIAARGSVDRIFDFDSEQARIAGTLIQNTRPFGLSFGDRACLALGITLGVPVHIADRAWSNLKLNIPVHVIR